MLWVKAFHLIAMVCWFAGLFYLPRLFVYHSDCKDSISDERFKVMERRLYRYIMTPAALLTTILGIWLLASYAWTAYHTQHWLWLKLILAVLLWGYQGWCGRLVRQFAQNKNAHSSKFYRIFNEIPSLFLIVMVILAVVKPF